MDVTVEIEPLKKTGPSWSLPLRSGEIATIRLEMANGEKAGLRKALPKLGRVGWGCSLEPRIQSIHPETMKIEREASLTPPLNPLPQGEGRYSLSPLPSGEG